MGFRRLAIVVRLALAAALAAAPLGAAAEMPRPLERWQVFDARSTRTVDHALWGHLLARYVTTVSPGVTRFAYAAVTAADRTALARYLAALSGVDVDRLSRDEQLAFWLNAHNAVLVKAVLDAWPVKSPNEAGGTFFSPGPWEEKSFRVAEVPLSLRDISDRIVRALWPDGLAIYGLACAAKGCPNLRAEPYRGEVLAAQLRANAADFVNRGPGVLGVQGDSARLSSFYHWHRDDLGGSEASVLSAIRSAAEGETARVLAAVESISGHGFDWSLNAPGTGR